MRRLTPAIAVSVLVALMGSTATVNQAAVDRAPLLPEGSVTEEVEPGVHRVISDGVRNLTRPVLAPTDESGRIHGIAAAEEAFASRIVAGPDGSVWLLLKDRFFRLGDERTHAWDVTGERSDQTPTRLAAVQATTDAWGQNHVVVTQDGQLWVSFQHGSLLRFDGDDWTRVEPGLSGFKMVNARVAPDGTVWVLSDKDRHGKKTRYALSRLDADGWTRVDLPPKGLDYWGVSEDSGLWAVRGRRVSRYADGSWTTTEARPVGDPGGLVTGPDGQLWATMSRTRDALGRLTGEGWEQHVMDLTVSHSFGYPGAPYSPASVDPRGAIWFVTSDGAGGDDWDAFLEAERAGCDGVVAFDGDTLRRYLDDMCIYDMDIAPDGKVWLQAGSWDGTRFAADAVGPVETYVITPEAVAGAE